MVANLQAIVGETERLACNGNIIQKLKEVRLDSATPELTYFVTRTVRRKLCVSELRNTETVQ